MRAPGSDGSSSVAANRRFYDSLCSASYLVPPQRFNTWPLLSGLGAAAPARLEIGPGRRPRLPVAGTHLVGVQPTGAIPPEGPRRSHDARRDYSPAIPRLHLRPGLRLRHRRTRRYDPADLLAALGRYSLVSGRARASQWSPGADGSSTAVWGLTHGGFRPCARIHSSCPSDCSAGSASHERQG